MRSREQRVIAPTRSQIQMPFERKAVISMPPKITDTVAWQQAELLMQPAFIRVIDHIRKQLDVSAWKGTYEDVLIWPVGTTDETKTFVNQLLQQTKTASPEEQAEIEQALTQLPTPHPAYYLCLQRQDQQFKVDLWELCYQVCFRSYSPEVVKATGMAVEIDTSLIEETGDVDWIRLDDKVGKLVEQVFANFPK